MTKVELLQLAIKKATDPEEVKKLNEELVKAIREEESAKLAKAAEDEAAVKARTAAAAPAPKVEPAIKVVSGDEICGFKIKRAVAGFKSLPRLARVSKEIGDERVEKVAVHMARLLAKAGLLPDGTINPAVATKAVMVEGTDALGGYVTPTIERMDILAYLRDFSVALQDCRIVPMTSDKMTIPAELAKVSVAKRTEANAATGTSATLSQVTLSTINLDGSVAIASELMSDEAATGGIIAWLTDQFMEAGGQGVDSCVFIDDGVAALASGIFKSYGYSQVFGSGSTNFSELLWTDLPGALAKLPAQYLGAGNHKWYINHAVLWTYFYKLKDTNDRPLFIPDFTGMAPYRLVGFPVRTPTYATSTTAAGGVLAVLTDLQRQYIIGERLNTMSLWLNPYSKGPHIVEATWQSRFAFANALKNYAVAIASAGT